MNAIRADSSNALFLGLDSSTQALKATVLRTDLSVVHEDTVNFDAEFPEFKTRGGVHRHADGLTVTSPALMWVAALDRLLRKMKDDGVPLGEIVAVSGSGQQHGSVWLKHGSRARLAGLDAARSLCEQLADTFSVEESPIWMDSSTTVQCRALEEAFGGAQALAELTGSRAYERFTGNQIAKIHQQEPQRYEATERIALVSSFVASLLIGDHAPIDAADGAGMNLMDLRKKKWSPRALDSTAPGLKRKLGAIVPSHTVIGAIHRYYVERFGFPANCGVIAFSGDNPNSLAGLRLQRPGDLAVSLGTSDTVFASLAEPTPSADEGHIFANPIDPDAYMALVCYKNGSLTREHVRDVHAGGSWEAFNRALRETPAGNNGIIGFYIKEPEITPPILKTGTWLFDKAGRPLENVPAAVHVRAVIEGQFLSMRLHGAHIGLKPTTILATGGASANHEILGVMGAVFGVVTRVAEKSDSASLGAAYRAMHGWRCAKDGRFVPFSETMDGAPPFRTVRRPDAASYDVYTEMLSLYAKLEKQVIAAAT